MPVPSAVIFTPSGMLMPSTTCPTAKVPLATAETVSVPAEIEPVNVAAGDPDEPNVMLMICAQAPSVATGA